MKKLITMVCILATLISMVAIAFAATEPATVELTVETVDTVETVEAPKSRNHPPKTTTAEVSAGFKMDLPSGYSVKVKDEATVLSNGSHTVEVTTQPAEMSEYDSVANAKRALIDAGQQKNMVEMNINGLPALGIVTEDGVYMVIVEAPDGQIITIRFLDFNAADDAYAAQIEKMLKSFVEI